MSQVLCAICWLDDLKALLLLFNLHLGYMIQSSEHILKWVDKRHKIPIYKKGNLPDVCDFYDTSDDDWDEIQEVFEKYESKGFFEIDMKYVNE
jgi:hypothetical protein